MDHGEIDESDVDEDVDEEWNQTLDAENDYGVFKTDKSDNYDVSNFSDHFGGECSSPLSSAHSMPVERMSLNDHKAGMKGLDKEKINKIIHDASKGSKFYENEKRKEKKVKEKIEAMKNELNDFADMDRKKALLESTRILKELSTNQDLSRIMVHVDMDAFYAAVEMRDRPELKDIPMAVGGMSMLSTSNYAARRYGVRAAMPGFIAKKLCPNLVIVPLHFDKYSQVSDEIREIFKEYDPNFSAVSLDEAFLDLTDYVTQNFMKYDYENTARDLAEIIVEEIRGKIFSKTQLTASAGIAPNMMLSKICSDINKPNGQYYLKPDETVIRNFLKDLPIRKINGIGRVSEEMLKALSIEKCCDMVEKRAILYLLFSDASFRYFMSIALGISSNRIVHSKRKGMSAERTFQNISDTQELLDICCRICKHLAEDMEKEKLEACNVTMKYKFSSFVMKTRSKTLPYSISKSEELYEVAKGLLLKEIENTKPDKFELRLMGVRVGSLVFRNNRKQLGVDSYFGSKKNILFDNRENGTSNNSDKSFNFNEIPIGQQTEMNLEVSENGGGVVEGMVNCPVCGMLKNNDIVELNLHIDGCLTKKTITEIIKEQETAGCSKKYISNSKPDCSLDEGLVKNKKMTQKRKNEQFASTGSSKKPTLHYFWEKR